MLSSATILLLNIKKFPLFRLNITKWTSITKSWLLKWHLLGWILSFVIFRIDGGGAQHIVLVGGVSLVLLGYLWWELGLLLVLGGVVYCYHLVVKSKWWELEWGVWSCIIFLNLFIIPLSINSFFLTILLQVMSIDIPIYPSMFVSTTLNTIKFLLLFDYMFYSSFSLCFWIMLDWWLSLVCVLNWIKFFLRFLY